MTRPYLPPSSANIRPCLSGSYREIAQKLVSQSPLATANAGALVLPVLMAGSVLGAA
jgi:hypothetical protein